MGEGYVKGLHLCSTATFLSLPFSSHGSVVLLLCRLPVYPIFVLLGLRASFTQVLPLYRPKRRDLYLSFCSKWRV